MLVLRWVNPSTSQFIKLYEQSSKHNVKISWISIEEVPWYLPAAIIASEDQRFPEHSGFDWRQIQIAIEDKFAGKQLRGASTISQQTIKNLFLWPEKSFSRKIIEGWLTIWMELLVPKKRIMEIYINIAQFSKSSFGVKAAAKHYFQSDVKNLSAQQSMLLATCLPAPSRCRLNNPSEYRLKKVEWIEKSMTKLGSKTIIDQL